MTTDDTPETDTVDTVPVVDPVAHNAGRLRGPKRLLLIGPVVAFAIALASSVTGADGRAGLVLLLLLLAMVFAVTGLWVGVQLVVDEFRGDPTSLRRGLLTVGMFLATLVCMIAFGGVVASAGAAA